MVIQWLHSVPFAQRITLLIVLIGLISSVFYALIWNPKTNEIEILKLSIIEVQQEIDVERSRADKFASLEAQLQNSVIGDISRKGMGTPVLDPRLFREDAVKIGNDFSLALTLWQPNRIDSTGVSGLRQFHIEGRFEGGYHQIAQSLAEIIRLPWVLELKHVRFNRQDRVAPGKQSLAADFRLLSIPVSPQQEWQYKARDSDGLSPIGQG